MADSAGAMNGGGTPVKARALWTVAPGRAELRDEILPGLQSGQARVRTIATVLSRGTERLVFNGLVSRSEWERMRAPLQVGSFPFPVKYGYCAVGVVEDGPADLLGRTVFALHPHQDVFVCATTWLTPVPDGLPPRRAVLGANMETALNALWDGGAGPGDRIVVIGAGIVGLLVTYLAARLPGAELFVHDRVPERQGLVEAFGARFVADAADLPQDADLVFHATASAGGLEIALNCCAMEASVVELSWYGDKQITIPLGGVFHSQRVRLISSQVGKVAPSRRERWPHARRLRKALALLNDPQLDVLIDETVSFDRLADRMPDLLAPEARGLTALIVYDT
jgi:NADPH:quinone reductase-like Zn-dependent oxidoreductase